MTTNNDQSSLVQSWITASRAQFSITLLLPGTLGIVIAASQGFFDGLGAALTLVGLFFANLGTNFTNDYFDYVSGVDAIDEGRQYKRGSEVLLASGLPAGVVLGSAIVSFVLMGVAGLLIALLVRPEVLWFGVIGLALGFFYTAPPLKLGYRGLGELVSGFGSGPLTVVGACFVQTGTISAAAVAASIPVGLLVAAILYVGNVPDAEADAKVGKRTLSVRFGRRLVRVLGPAFYAVTYLSIAVAVTAGWATPWALLALLSVPLAFGTLRVALTHYDDVHAYAPAIMKTVQVFASTTILLIGAFAAQALVTTP